LVGWFVEKEVVDKPLWEAVWQYVDAKALGTLDARKCIDLIPIVYIGIVGVRVGWLTCMVDTQSEGR